MTGKWLCVPVALCVLSVGCGGKKPEATDKGGPAVKQASTGGSPAAAPAEAGKAPIMTAFRLGSTAGPDGVVGVETRTFAPGDAVFTSFEIANGPAGSKVRIVWALMPDKKPVFRQEMPLAPDKPAVAFKGDSKGWQLGEYELETFLVEAGKDDARFLGTAPFKLVKDKPK